MRAEDAPPGGSCYAFTLPPKEYLHRL